MPVGPKPPAIHLPASLSPSHLKFIDAAALIHEHPDAAELAFMARQMVLCTLPHADPGNVPVWSRTTGAISLGIQPGVDLETHKSIGYPYGAIPRLLLFWITTEVQYRKNRTDLTDIDKRTLALGHNLDAFMRRIGLNPETGGGKRGDAKRLRDQMDRLFAARISFETKLQDGAARGKARGSMEITLDSELWWNPRKPAQQGVLWQSWVRLGERFYAALAANPVPVDMRALRALKRSPLALDLYAWICYRAFAMIQHDKGPQFVAWDSLAMQLGAGYTSLKNFSAKAHAALRKITAVYPGLRLTHTRGGFNMSANRLAIPQA